MRGLSILWALKMHPGGSASVAQLATETSLHRTTVKRLLETLYDVGFVQRGQSAGSYSLTFRVRQLGEGYRDAGTIGAVARPFLRELTEKALWPTNIVTMDGDAQLIVRESTHAFSPLSFRGAVLGQPVPFLQSASGKAYLTFCPDEERVELLDELRSRAAQSGESFPPAERINSVLNETRRRGYAVNESKGEGSRRFGTVAVPIRRGRKVIACLSIVYLPSAVSLEQILKRHLRDLKSIARHIEKKFVEMNESDADEPRVVGADQREAMRSALIGQRELTA